MSDSNSFKRRYIRLATLPEIGQEGVAKLHQANICIIGCGALGSLCAMYLSASGIGKLSIADFDNVDLSNLQRQLFFTEDNLGMPKASILAERMKALNSETQVEIIPKFITPKDAYSIFPQFDLIIDGSDNPNTKLMTDAVCADLEKPCVIGGVREFEGQIMTILPGNVRYMEIFGTELPCSGLTPCSATGVLGPAAGVVASLQASEAIKIITGAGSTLANRLLILDLLNMNFQTLNLS